VQPLRACVLRESTHAGNGSAGGQEQNSNAAVHVLLCTYVCLRLGGLYAAAGRNSPLPPTTLSGIGS